MLVLCCKFVLRLIYAIVDQTRTLSASWMSASFLPVAGLMVGNVLPLTELTHLLLINS